MCDMLDKTDDFLHVVFSGSKGCLNMSDDPMEVLKVQLQEFTERLVDGNEGGRPGDKHFVCEFIR